MILMYWWMFCILSDVYRDCHLEKMEVHCILGLFSRWLFCLSEQRDRGETGLRWGWDQGYRWLAAYPGEPADGDLPDPASHWAPDYWQQPYNKTTLHDHHHPKGPPAVMLWSGFIWVLPLASFVAFLIHYVALPMFMKYLFIFLIPNHNLCPHLSGIL